MSSRMHCGPLRVEEQARATDSPSAAGTAEVTVRATPGKGSADRSAPGNDPWGPAPTRRPPSRGLRRILAPL
jgi:hypothetical protein